jgi:glycosyltransferase involved in cell wall biosynthesis
VTHLVLVALKDAPVHHALMEAYRKAFLRQRDVSGVTWIVSDEYVKLIRKEDQVVALGPGRAYASILRRIPSQIARIRRLRREEVIPDSSGENGDSHVFVEAMHPNHWALMRHLRRILPRPSIRYYLHEPTGWAEKVAKGDGLFHATTVYLTQWVDMFQPDLIYVSTPRLAERLGRNLYPVPGLGERARVLPLPFADVATDLVPEAFPALLPRTVLFLGRADERRCMDIFFATAAEAQRRGNGWSFVMLSGSAPTVPLAAASLPNLRLEIGRRYSDEDQYRELRLAGYVFNLYRVKYSQSGVSPVALMFGVPLIANPQERDPSLERAGCVYFDDEPSPGELMDRLEARPSADRTAIRRHYLATHDASSLVIP